MTEEALIDWYLNEKEAEIESEEELIATKKLIEKVIKRLIEHVRTMLPY